MCGLADLWTCGYAHPHSDGSFHQNLTASPTKIQLTNWGRLGPLVPCGATASAQFRLSVQPTLNWRSVAVLEARQPCGATFSAIFRMIDQSSPTHSSIDELGPFGASGALWSDFVSPILTECPADTQLTICGCLEARQPCGATVYAIFRMKNGLRLWSKWSGATVSSSFQTSALNWQHAVFFEWMKPCGATPVWVFSHLLTHQWVLLSHLAPFCN